ncbi:MAG: hypothetical protein CMP24_01115 [Rickettsiales bacterium]|nr:hypothetical protein [Rickettsiales bacterium]|tara:strand:- start:52 stop:555 length:504 start_codon:yes stop_codon:yes gene_type:complete
MVFTITIIFMTSKLEKNFEDNFAFIWIKFLEFEIKRSCEAIKLAGGARRYLVLQIICWHNLLIVSSSLNKNQRQEIVEHWHNLSKKGYDDAKILTYSLISKLSGLSVETVRRHVKKLIKDKWVTYTKKTGVVFSASEENNKKLTDDFNVKETQMFKELIMRINSLDN